MKAAQIFIITLLVDTNELLGVSEEQKDLDIVPWACPRWDQELGADCCSVINLPSHALCEDSDLLAMFFI